MRQYLARKEVPEDQLNETLEWLAQFQYLDDPDFARRWAEHRRRGAGRSDARIRAELRQKGIDDDDIAAALQSSELSQSDVLKALINKRRHRYADEQKLIQYLARQGFSWSEIQKALKTEQD